VFSNLIENNIVKMMFKGIVLSPILESDLMLHPINFNEWPEKSKVTDNFMVAYNESKLTLRYKYSEIFKEQFKTEEIERLEIEAGTYVNKGERIGKINFEINMLSDCSPHENDTIMDALSQSDELEVFDIHVVKDTIDYKFYTFAFNIHLVGFYVHISYIVILMSYIIETFLGELDELPDGSLGSMPEPTRWLLWCSIVCLLYPTMFEVNQLQKQGLKYLSGVWNYIDIAHIVLGYVNIYTQLHAGSMSFVS